MTKMEIKRLELTPDILKQVRKLDKKFYHNSKLTQEWYLERYKNYHHGYFLCLNKKIVGYLIAVPVSENLYEAITNGVLVDDVDINPQMFLEKSVFYYLVSIVITKKYRHHGYAKELTKALLQEKLPNLCTMTISKEGYLLAQKFFKETNKINENISIFQNT